MVINLGLETENIMYFPHSSVVICRVHYEYMERTFFKQRQQEIKSSSITVMNILFNCWWLLFHCIAMPSLLFCSQALQQIKSYSGLFPFSRGPETRAEPASSDQYLLKGSKDAAGGNRFLPDKAEDKYPSHLLSLDWNDTSLHLSLIHDSYNHSSLSLTCP